MFMVLLIVTITIVTAVLCVVDLLLIAVRPDLQNKGINAIILDHVMKSCIRNGITHAESGPQLELNYKINSQWKGFDIEQHKRRRCFVKKLQ